MVRTCLCITVLTFLLFNAVALLAAGSGYLARLHSKARNKPWRSRLIISVFHR